MCPSMVPISKQPWKYVLMRIAEKKYIKKTMKNFMKHSLPPGLNMLLTPVRSIMTVTLEQPWKTDDTGKKMTENRMPSVIGQNNGYK